MDERFEATFCPSFLGILEGTCGNGCSIVEKSRTTETDPCPRAEEKVMRKTDEGSNTSVAPADRLQRMILNVPRRKNDCKSS